MTAEKNQAKTISTPIEQLRQLVAEDLGQLDARIFEFIKSHTALIPEISEHTIAAGGKRLRPMLTLAASQLCGYQGQAHIALAIAVEFIHTATLLHDDVVDGSGLRRGKKTANILWGNKEAILVGDYLFAKSFTLMSEANSLKIYNTLSEASVVIAEGEVLQLEKPQAIGQAEEWYEQVIRAKTAELFSAACRVGAMVAERPEEEVQALADYGTYLGLAFQMIDDVMDYASDDARLGKAKGDDFAEAKLTLPVILAYQKANAAQRADFDRWFLQKESAANEFTKAASYITELGALEQTVSQAKAFVNKAAESLDVFSTHPVKQALLNVLDFVVERKY